MSSYQAGEVEFLVHDAHGPSRRTLVLVALLVATLSLTGLLVDRRVRGTETRALERCAAGAHAAVEQRESRVNAMAAYVRPALYGRFPGAVGDGLLEMVSAEAEKVAGTLDEPRRACARVDLLPHHTDLRERRAACVAYLEEHAAFLDAVSLDGLTAYRESPDPGRGC